MMRTSFRSLAFVLLLIAATSRSARAQENNWYGGETIVVDLASIATTVVGASANSSGLAVVGLGGLALGGPIVHFAHGRPGAALGSLALRVGLFVAGKFIGDGCGGVYVGALGGLIGVVGAITLDAALLAHGEDPRSSGERSTRATGKPHVTSVLATFDPHTRSASIGLGGSF